VARVVLAYWLIHISLFSHDSNEQVSIKWWSPYLQDIICCWNALLRWLPAPWLSPQITGKFYN